VFPAYVTTTVNIGRAMIQVAATQHHKQFLFSTDINHPALDSERSNRPRHHQHACERGSVCPWNPTNHRTPHTV
jgi:hypothetical protein